MSQEQLSVPFQRRSDNYQPNLITESKQTFSELEKKIVVLLINQLGQVAKNWREGQSLRFMLPVSELTETNQQKIIRAAERLMDKKIHFAPDADVDFHAIVPFPEVVIRRIQKKSFLDITLYATAVPLFIELGTRYTRYNLEVMLSLESAYAQRIYELIMMHVGRGEHSFVYEVDKLQFMLNCPSTYQYRDLQRRALKPAQQELAEKSGLLFEYEPERREWNRIVSLRFTVLDPVQVGRLALGSERESFQKASRLQQIDYTTRLLNNYRFSRAQQQEILADPDKLNKFMQLDGEIAHGIRPDVLDPTAYIAASLGWKNEGKPARRKP